MTVIAMSIVVHRTMETFNSSTTTPPLFQSKHRFTGTYGKQACTRKESGAVSPIERA